MTTHISERERRIDEALEETFPASDTPCFVGAGAPKPNRKGRGLWSTNGDRTPWLKEGGKGSKPRAVHIQVRPDPLAK
jgi:hypothetical protein